MKQASTVKRTTVKTKTPVKNRVETPLSQTTCTNEEFLKKVQEKAYELYVARGCVHGHDVEDWIRALKIVKDS